jgi:hypothetical protein
MQREWVLLVNTQAFGSDDPGSESHFLNRADLLESLFPHCVSQLSFIVTKDLRQST